MLDREKHFKIQCDHCREVLMVSCGEYPPFKEKPPKDEFSCFCGKVFYGRRIKLQKSQRVNKRRGHERRNPEKVSDGGRERQE